MTSPGRHVTEWDLDLAVISQDQAVLVLVEAIRRYGAADLEIGYDGFAALEADPDSTAEPGPTDDVRWYARSTFHHRLGKQRTSHTVEGESWAGPTHGRSHEVAQIHALADIVRKRGGRVTFA